MTILNSFIEAKYEDIMLMSKKICKSNSEWEELGHFCIEKFMFHERAEELIEANRAMNFLSGIMHRSFHSSTSQYHTEIRQKGRMHGFNGHEHLEQRDIEYDEELDIITGHIETILEEQIVGGNILIWFRVTLFQMWLQTPNFSELARITGIPRTSISTAVDEAKEYIRQELKNRGIDYEY